MCLKFIFHFKKKKNLKNLFLNHAIQPGKAHRFAEKDETDVLVPDIYVYRMHGGFLPGEKAYARGRRMLSCRRYSRTRTGIRNIRALVCRRGCRIRIRPFYKGGRRAGIRAQARIRRLHLAPCTGRPPQRTDTRQILAGRIDERSLYHGRHYTWQFIRNRLLHRYRIPHSHLETAEPVHRIQHRTERINRQGGISRRRLVSGRQPDIRDTEINTGTYFSIHLLLSQL